MSTLHWNSMLSAPKDGTIVVLIYFDASGILPAFWGKDRDGEEGWRDLQDCSTSFEVMNADRFAGWIEAPFTPQWLEVVGAS